MVNVVRSVKIPWDPLSEDITILTNSEIGSEEKVYVQFTDSNNQAVGTLVISFLSSIQYNVGYCTTSSTPFPVSPPAETEKTWKISYDQAALRLTIHCNEVEVLNEVLSDVCNQDGWRDTWMGRKPTKISLPPPTLHLMSTV